MDVRLGIRGTIAELFGDIVKTMFKTIFEGVPINLY